MNQKKQSVQLNQNLVNSMVMSSPYMNPQVYQQSMMQPVDLSGLSPTRSSYNFQRQFQKKQSIQKPLNDFDSPSFQQGQQTSVLETQMMSPVNRNRQRTKSQNFGQISIKDSIESICNIYLNNTQIFKFKRMQPVCCCKCPCNSYNIIFYSQQLEASINYRSDNCIASAFRYLRSICCPMPSLPESESRPEDSLRIEAYDGKGSVYLKNNLLGTFKRVSPPKIAKVFCNYFIELQITPEYGTDTFIIKRQSDCFNGFCECFISNNFPCCSNEVEIGLFKDKNFVLTESQLLRSDCTHCVQLLGLNCLGGKWNEMHIDLNNATLSCQHRCLILGAFFYFIEFCN